MGTKHVRKDRTGEGSLRNSSFIYVGRPRAQEWAPLSGDVSAPFWSEYNRRRDHTWADPLDI